MKEVDRIKNIVSEEEFRVAINLDKAIIYFLVNWSDQERISRSKVHQILNEIDVFGIPIFQIDCSTHATEYVINWLLEQKNSTKGFIYGGYGETILVNKGEIIDFINYPGQFEFDKLKEKISDWVS